MIVRALQSIIAIAIIAINKIIYPSIQFLVPLGEFWNFYKKTPYSKQGRGKGKLAMGCICTNQTI